MSTRGVSIWNHPAPGIRRPRFSRQQIAEAALAIADLEGIEAVSMRRVAADLDAGVMSLYRYVRTKDDLIDLMDDAVIGELLVPEDELPTSWREAVALIAERTREAYEHHPWAAYPMPRSMPGPNAARHGEQSLAVLANAPLTRHEKIELWAIIDDFVVGHAIRSAKVAARMILIQSTEAAIDLGLAELGSGRYPHSEAFLNGSDPRETLRDATDATRVAERFERGLAAILASVAQR